MARLKQVKSKVVPDKGARQWIPHWRIYANGVQSAVIFIETSIFSKQVKELLPDDEFREMQSFLVRQPAAGDMIQETGGARKLRWRRPGMGKRGGVRTIYYYAVAEDQIWLLLMYPKGERDDLSADQKKQLKKIIAVWAGPV